MTLEEKRALVASLFTDTVLFESKVLRIHTDADRSEVMRLITESLINEQLAASLHFSHLKSYDELTAGGILPSILKVIIAETVHFLQEELRYTAAMAKEVVGDTEHLRFMKQLCKTYYAGHKTIIFEKVADTLLEKIAALSSPAKGSRLLKEAVEGSDKRVSLMVLDGGVKIVVNLEQAWKHVHRAYLARKKEISAVQLALSKHLTALEELEDDAEKEKKELLALYAKKEAELKRVRSKPLDRYDATLKRMKQAIVQRLSSKDFSRPA